MMQLSKAAEEEMTKLRRLLTVAKGERDALRAQVAALEELTKLFIPDLPESVRVIAEKRLAAITAKGQTEFRPPGCDSFCPSGASLVSTISATPSGF